MAKRDDRICLILPKALRENLKLFVKESEQGGEKQSGAETIRQALTQFLVARGYQPDKIPVITYTHRYSEDEQKK